MLSSPPITDILLSISRGWSWVKLEAKAANMEPLPSNAPPSWAHLGPTPLATPRMGALLDTSHHESGSRLAVVGSQGQLRWGTQGLGMARRSRGEKQSRRGWASGLGFVRAGPGQWKSLL